MSQVAKVTSVTATCQFDAARTPIDVVQLSWNGSAFSWITTPGQYQVGQDVAINLPVSAGQHITPA